jgi:hypothetical protein
MMPVGRIILEHQMASPIYQRTDIDQPTAAILVMPATNQWGGQPGQQTDVDP